MDFGVLFKDLGTHILKTSVIDQAKIAYLTSFMAQIPPKVAAKLTEEEKKELAELSWEIMAVALSTSGALLVEALNK